MLLAQVDNLTTRIDQLTAIIDSVIAEISTGRLSSDIPTGGVGGPRPAIERISEIPGTSRYTAQIIIAEIGLDMSVFLTVGHLVSWAKVGSPHYPVRSPETGRQDRQGQPLPQRRTRTRCGQRSQDQHLPR
jgi:transposase